MSSEQNNMELDIYIDYIEVDQQERTLFHNNDIDYFFDITERPIQQTMKSNNERVILHYTRPVKELFIVFTTKENENSLYDFKKIKNLEIRLNDIKLETSNDESYFRLLQPYFHNRKAAKNIYMYSFAFDPDNAQPTGAYNFGNLRTKELTIIGDDIVDNTVHIYANTNNVLKVNEGQSNVQFI